MARGKPAKRAKKPPKISAKQIARLRGEEAAQVEPSHRGPSNVHAVMLDGPLRCLTPIPRSDLPPGCPSWTAPYGFGTVTYILDRREGDTHFYKEATDEP